jgi:hypothetical protein
MRWGVRAWINRIRYAFGASRPLVDTRNTPAIRGGEAIVQANLFAIQKLAEKHQIEETEAN